MGSHCLAVATAIAGPESLPSGNLRTRSGVRLGVRACGILAIALCLACSEPGAVTDAMVPQTSAAPTTTPTPPAGVHHHGLVGDLDGLDASHRRAFLIGPHFDPMPPVQAGDWLEHHPEPGQTVAQFVASDHNAVTPDRRTIYLQPIGPLPHDRGPTIDELTEHAGRYFGLPTAILPAKRVADLDIARRRHDGVVQLHAGDVLDELETQVPADAYCVIALTLQDLYPGDDYNYVFGLARLEARVGVFSFARYHPDFFEPGATIARSEIMRRAFKVMTHEIGHMFGLEHCTFFRCNMNGSNNLSELDDEPAHLCPVCLRKLHLAVGFDPRARYDALVESYSRAGMFEETEWALQRSAWLDAAP